MSQPKPTQSVIRDCIAAGYLDQLHSGFQTGLEILKKALRPDDPFRPTDYRHAFMALVANVA